MMEKVTIVLTPETTSLQALAKIQTRFPEATLTLHEDEPQKFTASIASWGQRESDFFNFLVEDDVIESWTIHGWLPSC